MLHACYGEHVIPVDRDASLIVLDVPDSSNLPAGAGALSSPLVATQFSQMPRWSFHYLVSLGLAVINVCMITAVFRFRTLEGASPLPPLYSGTESGTDPYLAFPL